MSNTHNEFELQHLNQNTGDINENNNLYIPVNSRFDSRPVYVNPKQYNAILKRRMKKIKKNLMYEKTQIKKRNKSIKRSIHAKNRKRDKTGKFSSKQTQKREKGMIEEEKEEVEEKNIFKEEEQ